MIAAIKGTVIAKHPSAAVIDVNGVGYRVELPAHAAGGCEIGADVSFVTQLVVREDSLTLYGFASPQQLEVFNLLIAVTGVGPRSALGILSTLSTAEIVAAVAADNPKPFTTVSGIGPKTAKLLVLSLAGKLAQLSDGAPAAAASAAPADPAAGAKPQVIAGLVGLGWSEQQAAGAVADALASGAATDSDSPQTLLRATLALLQR